MTDNLHNLARDLWSREGGPCVSSLVHTLAAAYGGDTATRDLGDLTEQAFELAAPIEDWEEAAREAGWEADGRGFWFNPETDQGKDEDLRAEDLDLEPHYREVFEHWIVSGWLADELEKRGEKVDRDFAGLTIWARTTTGQAVYCDGVIEQIAADLHGDR